MTHTLILTDHELRAVLSGLRKLRTALISYQRRDERLGFHDHKETNAKRLATVETLLARHTLPDADEVVVIATCSDHHAQMDGRCARCGTFVR
jgi:hypothetical protein